MSEFETSVPITENFSNQYKVIRDTREKEKKGWYFHNDGMCLGTIDEKMDEGDYTLYGYEDRLCIERKGAVTEFAQNLTQSRFYKELERMERYDFPFLLLEFTMNDIVDYPNTIMLPKRVKDKIKVTGKFLLKKIIEIDMKYKTKILFCGHNGMEVVTSIFKRVIE